MKVSMVPLSLAIVQVWAVSAANASFARSKTRLLQRSPVIRKEPSVSVSVVNVSLPK